MKIKIYNDLGVSKESIRHCIYSLKCHAPKNYSIEYISAAEIIGGQGLKNTCLLILPGGRDLLYVQKLKGEGDTQIQNYIANGGNFLGICAGSYYSGNYLEFAQGSNKAIIGKRELNIFQGTVKGPILSPYYYSSDKGASAAHIKVNVNTNIEDCYVFYNGGGYFVDAETVKNAEIIANYENSSKAAIIRCQYGKGIAILSGVHPEYAPMIMQRKSLNNIRKILEQYNDQRIMLFEHILKMLIY